MASSAAIPSNGDLDLCLPNLVNLGSSDLLLVEGSAENEGLSTIGGLLPDGD